MKTNLSCFRGIPTGLALAAALHGVVVQAAPQPWAAELTYSGGGYWTTRVPITVTAPARTPLEGLPVTITLSGADGTRSLMGKRVAGLRAVNENGAELVLGLETSGGILKRDGVLAQGDRISVPVAAGPGKTQRVYLYAGNPRAWLPPEWFGAAALANGGFEAGKSEPAAWRPAAVDAQHRMVRQQGGARSGKWCARCEVDPGAAPTWVKYQQGGIRVLPGEKYRFTGWVKARDVRGRVGWYVHVDGKRPQLVNKSETWDGTFDWRMATIEFEVPPGGSVLSCGTLLHGSGTAWFDDARLEKTTAAAQPEVRVGSAETLRLRRMPTPAAWRAGPDWRWRAEIMVRNHRYMPVRGGIVTADLRRIHNQVVKQLGFTVIPSYRLIDPVRPGTPLSFSGDPATEIRFAANIAARSIKTFHLYINPKTDAAGASPVNAQFDWAAARANLVENGTMEQGQGEKPSAWDAGEEGRPGHERFSARRVPGGQTGKWQLELSVPASIEKPGWCGWRQKVPVKPGTRYLLTGSVRSRDLDGNVAIYGHFLRKDGSLTERPYFSTTPGITGDREWTRTAATVLTPADCAFIEIHLTMNRHGTVWHDNVALVELLAGRTGAFEARTPQAAPLAAWSVNPLVKVFREDLPPARVPETAEVYVARNAWRTAVIAVRSTRAGELRIHVTRLETVDGAVLPEPTLYRAAYVPVDFPVGYDSTTEPSWHRHFPRRRGNDGWTGWWPDPLVPVKPKTPLELRAGETQALYIDFRVPAEASPGGYRGAVVLTSGQDTVRVPLRVRVWSLRLPDERRLPALYDLRNGPGKKAFGGAAATDAKIWYRFLARYNVSPSFVMDQPGFEWKDGLVQMDTAAFDATAAFLFDNLHVAKVYTPRFFYACGWAYPPKKIFGLEPFSPEYVKAWKQAYRLFIDHITTKGWRDRFVFYISDEPHESSEVTITGLARIADMAREIAPDVPIYSSTWRYIEGLAGHITLWGAGPQGSFAPDEFEARKKAGDRFWFTTDGQMCLDTPYLGIEYLLPWFCLKYGCEAYEFWGVSWWTHDPWERGWHTYISQSSDGKEFRWVRYPNGDGFLAYPGDRIGHPGPIPSIRLVAAREGVDDYEVLVRLARLAARGDSRATQALSRVRELVNSPNPGGRYSTAVMPDPAAVRQAAIRAAQVLETAAGAR